MSGAPLDGGHAERASGVASAAGVEVACGNVVEDEEKDATDAAHEEVREGDEAGVLELEDAEAIPKVRFANRPKVFMILRTLSLSLATWRSSRLALRARKRRVAPPQHHSHH